MYCSNCGVKAGGNFCAACGANLQTPGEPQIAGEPQMPTPPSDWTDEIVYETLLLHPDVRERVAKASQQCKQGINGEDLLSLYDSVDPTGVPVGKLVMGMVPIMDRIGIKTGKKSELTLRAPAGKTLVAILCGMARKGFEIQKVDQSDEGCVLTALIPSTMWTYRGELVVGVERSQGSMHIQAAAKISGQLIDWGKSDKTLREFFEEIRRELSPKEPPALPPRSVA